MRNAPNNSAMFIWIDRACALRLRGAARSLIELLQWGQNLAARAGIVFTKLRVEFLDPGRAL